MTVEHNNCHGLKELISNNAILEAIRNAENNINKTTYDSSVATQKYVSDGTISGINTTNLSATATQKYVSDGTVSTTKAVTDNGVAITKTVTDYGMMNSDTTNRNGTAVTKTVTDGFSSAAQDLARLHNEVLATTSEIRQEVATIGTANALAAKDIQIAIFKDGAHTREETQEAICELAKDTAKGFADAALLAAQNKAALEMQALQNKCDLAAQIAECCCEQKLLTTKEASETRALILAEGQKRLEAQNARLEMELLICKSKHHGEGR